MGNGKELGDDRTTAQLGVLWLSPLLLCGWCGEGGSAALDAAHARPRLREEGCRKAGRLVEADDDTPASEFVTGRGGSEGPWPHGGSNQGTRRAY